MILLFELSMPSANSWNGRWSGEERYHALTRKFTTVKGGKHAAEILAQGSFYYRWDDGWSACITVKEATPAEARAATKRSVGFAGYDWMVDSILRDGKILADHERAALNAEATA